jgi:hypothetical protein
LIWLRRSRNLSESTVIDWGCTCQQIFHSGRCPVSRGENLRIEILEGWTHGGDPSHIFKGIGGNRSSTLEYSHAEESGF